MNRGAILVGLGGVVLGAGIAIAALARSQEVAPAAAPHAPVRSAAIPAIAAAPAPAARAARTPQAPRVGHTGPLPELVTDLSDRDPKIRRAAIREATRDGDLDPALLRAAVRDPDLEVGVIATIALGKRYAEGGVAVGELVDVVADKGLNDRVRVSALNSIGLVPSAEGAALLTELLAHGSTTERASAAILLVHQDAELAMPALIGALGDAEDLVRTNALDSLRARARGRDFGSSAAAWQAWWQSRAR